jgi:phosphohistidine swiveling domain-containing protein
VACPTIRSDEASYYVTVSQPTDLLETAYQQGILPARVQHGMARFLQRYGARGVAEIDIGRPRWQDQPAPLFNVLQGYLRLADASQSPQAIFKRGAETARTALEELHVSLRRQGLTGVLKARILGFLYHRIRVLAGLREMPKFTIIRVMGALRERLLREGETLVEQGVFDRANDIFFADMGQLAAFAGGEISADSLREAVLDARAAYDRELRRTRVPRVITSAGEAFYAGIPAPPDGATADRLVGTPVSPGVAEGRVRVVLDPHNAGLEPGEIMVCPATDPGWTPLFLTAAGLVMEMGGMMTHGSVVAREYGIPAVVGVDNATQRLITGQHVRLDGTAGLVEVLA